LAENPASRMKRWIVATIKLLLVVAVVWFIRRTIVDAWDQLAQQQWQFHAGWLTASGALYLLGTLSCGIFWHRILLALKQPVKLSLALRAYYLGHLGKYVPGKAMVVILRAGLIRGQGVDTSLAAVSVFFETLTMMSSGAFMAAAIVAVWFHKQGPRQGLLFWAALATMVAAGIPTLPPVFRRLVRLVGVGRKDPQVIEKLDGLGYRTMWLGWALAVPSWLILGLSFWAVLRGLGIGNANPLEQLPLYTAAVTFATVAGFVSLIPGGAVVREAVLAEVMIQYLGGGAALISAVLLRLVWLVSELVISGMLYFAPRR
jgi:glycosyltransferase 2 family protein